MARAFTAGGLVFHAVAIPALCAPPDVRFAKESPATVWERHQVVEGTAEGASSWFPWHNGRYVDRVSVDDEGRFRVKVALRDGVNSLRLCSRRGGDADKHCSRPMELKLGFRLRPRVKTWAESAAPGKVILRSEVTVPDGQVKARIWRADPDNPRALPLTSVRAPRAEVRIPADAPAGEYYFDLEVTASDGDRSRARTFFTITDRKQIRPFRLENDRAAWIEKAVVYGVSPWYHARGYGTPGLRALIPRLREIAELGADVLWLQPVTVPAAPGQAYDVADYFGVWPELGTERDLRELVASAHRLGLRVLLDLVPNHSSRHHPFAKDAVLKGERSHYFDFFLRQPDTAPYHRHYQIWDPPGAMSFVSYFWKDMVLFDYRHPGPRNFIRHVSRYWIERFDVDGYRLDASWGPAARWPGFYQELVRTVKALKPEALILAEDKAGFSAAYHGTTRKSVFESGIDLAYDWGDEADWVSRWAWQIDEETTVFDLMPEGSRAAALHRALDRPTVPRGSANRILRYLQNNDTEPFLRRHGAERTRMAVALQFAVPGVPLIFYGQELGADYPRWHLPAFEPGKPLKDHDGLGLWQWHHKLIRLRRRIPALTGPNWERIRVSAPKGKETVYGFRRWAEQGAPAVVLVNLGSGPREVRAEVPVQRMGLTASRCRVRELLTEMTQTVPCSDLKRWSQSLPPYTTRIFLVEPGVLPKPYDSVTS